MRSLLFFKITARLFLAFCLFVFMTSFSSERRDHTDAYSLGVKKHLENDTLPSIEQKTSDTAEVEASVDIQAWKQNLETGLQPIVEKAARKGMKPGLYTVQVRFLIEKDGSISDVKALNDPGYGLAKGVEKIISKGPKWTPGTVNGKVVRSYHSQPVSFVISK
jgi:hypothetical protein